MLLYYHQDLTDTLNMQEVANDFICAKVMFLLFLATSTLSTHTYTRHNRTTQIFATTPLVLLIMMVLSIT